MIRKLTSIFLLILQIYCDVQYASGYSAAWYGGYYYVGTTYTQTINFPQSFQRVPQVSINTLVMCTTLKTETSELGYYLSVSTITTSQFIVCLSTTSNTVRYITFYWIAVDDNRIEILSNFNVVNPQSTTLQHNNVNANTGIIILTSFHGKTKLDFTLSLGTITPTTVDVNIVQQNMISLGYIVVLGPSEFFNIENEIIQVPKDASDSNRYASREVLKEDNKIWIFFFKYFTFTADRELNTQLLPEFTSTSTKYGFYSWSGNGQSFTQCVHQCVTLNLALSIMKPMLFQKLRISGLFQEQTDIIEFSIIETNQIYQQPVVVAVNLIPQNLSTLNFKLRVKCDRNYMISGQFYQCTSCSDQYKKATRYCYSSGISLTFYIKYTIQNIGFYQQLSVSITSTQIIIQQTVINQTTSQTILLLQFDIE